VRVPILQGLGSALVHRDALLPADVIAVTLDAGSAGALEAADLIQAGIAKRVIVFSIAVGAEGREFLRRGLPYEDLAKRQIRQLQTLGVGDIAQIPDTISGTHDEIRLLIAWCEQNQLQSVVLITTTDHSRRMRRALNRATQGRSLHVSVQPTRYSRFDPADWWQQREGLRTGIIELEKLLLDVVRHPISR
jgi:uncharacterized SAM-binding protein YcdF (DUF218 family)